MTFVEQWKIKARHTCYVAYKENMKKKKTEIHWMLGKEAK